MVELNFQIIFSLVNICLELFLSSFSQNSSLPISKKMKIRNLYTTHVLYSYTTNIHMLVLRKEKSLKQFIMRSGYLVASTAKKFCIYLPSISSKACNIILRVLHDRNSAKSFGLLPRHYQIDASKYL